ncbi:hypothetical protein Tco_1329820 [Tanacetum coccineum]
MCRLYNVHIYKSMIGSLVYLTTSRPNIMFAVCACARFQVTPKASHLNAVKRIFRYLKHQPNLGLWYPRDSPFVLEAFSDSDYGGANLNRKSTTGGCQFLGRRLISWQYKKQTIVANSTTKAEYVAAANYYGQVLWIQNQMMDYGFNFMNTKIHINNESTICIVKNPVYHSRTKHIEIHHHFIRDCKRKEDICGYQDFTLMLKLQTSSPKDLKLRATYGAELVSAARLVNTARSTLSTARLGSSSNRGINKKFSFFNDADGTAPTRSILTLKPLPTIDPKDKGKGVLKESPVKKVKRSDLDEAQIAKDAKIARLIHEKELAEMEKER